MARPTNKLSTLEVKNEARPGRHSDGGGLYLQIEKGGSKSWTFMWKRDGKRTAMGLGAYSNVGLAGAREKAEAARKIVAAGGDPLVEARRETEKEQHEKTFAEAAEAFLDADREASWRNAKHRAQWRMVLFGPAEQKGKRRKAGDYCRHLRPMKVREIATGDVLFVLKSVWRAKPETASRLRGRIEQVLSFAKMRGWRSGENPAAWRGHLDAVLPKPEKLKVRGHHRALPYADMPDFVARLRSSCGMDAKVFEFTILTAARSGEAVGATWDEIDLDRKIWTVPASRMKANRKHEVPLSGRAVEILKALAETRPDDNPHVFPGLKRGRPISAAAMEQLLRRWEMKGQTTIHGVRSAFRDWVGDATSFPREVAEAALAHVVGDKAEQAYRRGTALERRRELMEAWSVYLGTGNGGGKVVPLAGRRKATAE